MAKELLSLQEVIKKINKNFGENVARVGVPALQTKGRLSFGTPSLDFCTYNNLIEGTFIELNGLESSGKTTLAFLLAANFMKKEKERNPENPRSILFVDAEATCDPQWALQSAGYDMNDSEVKTIYVQGAGQTAEEYFDLVREAVSTGEIGLVIFDSLTMVVGQQVMDESLEKKQMGGASGPIGDFCKRAVGVFNRNKCTFIGINGLTENLTGYGDVYNAPGGKTWKRTCSYRIRVKKGDFFDNEGNILAKKDAQSPAGHIIEIYVEKIKSAPWDRKLGTTNLNYTYGLDIIQDTIDTAIRLNLIDNSVQGSFKLVDPDTGEILHDEDGNEIKIRGKKNIKPYFKDHPELFKSLYDKCYDMMARREDPNVVAFERLLNVDVDAVIGGDTE